MKPAILSVIVVLVAALSAFTEHFRAAAADQEFVMKAAEGGMLEVKLGKLATEKGTRSKVKDFGKNMITDHTKVNEELKALAGKKNIQVPAALSAAKQAKYDSLASQSGDQFDMLYINMMIASHEETIGLFQAESNKGEDADVKKWADSKIPALKHHLEMAKALFPAKSASQSHQGH